MVYKCNSEEDVVFLLSISKGLSQLNFYTLNSIVGLNSLSEAISGLFTSCWGIYANKYIITT